MPVFAAIQKAGCMTKEIVDAAAIFEMLDERLVKVAVDQSGWRLLYRDRNTGQLWQLDYPQSEMHGGGPPRLRELTITAPPDWEYSN